jgi:hypothetical protein
MIPQIGEKHEKWDYAKNTNTLLFSFKMHLFRIYILNTIKKEKVVEKMQYKSTQCRTKKCNRQHLYKKYRKTSLCLQNIHQPSFKYCNQKHDTRSNKHPTQL